MRNFHLICFTFQYVYRNFLTVYIQYSLYRNFIFPIVYELSLYNYNTLHKHITITKWHSITIHTPHTLLTYTVITANYPHCTEPDGLLQHLQATATCPHSKLDESNPCLTIPNFPSGLFELALPTKPHIHHMYVSFMPYAQPISVMWLPKYLVSAEHKAHLNVVIFTPLVVTVTNWSLCYCTMNWPLIVIIRQIQIEKPKEMSNLLHSCQC
jgi:hypothetical protein